MNGAKASGAQVRVPDKLPYPREGAGPTHIAAWLSERTREEAGWKEIGTDELSIDAVLRGVKGGDGPENRH